MTSGNRQLAVKMQDVVPGQAEAADGCLLCEASMGPVPVIAMQPYRQGAVSLFGVIEGSCVGPFSEHCLNEAFGLAVGLRRVRLGGEMLDAELLAGPRKGFRAVATAVVGHDAFDSDAEAFVVADRRGNVAHAHRLIAARNTYEPSGTVTAIRDDDAPGIRR